MKILVLAAKNRAERLKRCLCPRCGCVVELEKKDFKNNTARTSRGNYPEPGGGCSKMVEYTFPCPNRDCRTTMSILAEPHEKLF